mmetsp:Transcript_14968/g.56831  ORF Transcript_14968/g.56831 Transcript_14968/m.56831 type:complete len:201 (-) Transcript_14968:650-1252(-)
MLEKETLASPVQEDLRHSRAAREWRRSPRHHSPLLCPALPARKDHLLDAAQTSPSLHCLLPSPVLLVRAGDSRPGTQAASGRRQKRRDTRASRPKGSHTNSDALAVAVVAVLVAPTRRNLWHCSSGPQTSGTGRDHPAQMGRSRCCCSLARVAATSTAWLSPPPEKEERSWWRRTRKLTAFGSWGASSQGSQLPADCGQG